VDFQPRMNGVVIDEVLWIPPVSPEAIDVDPPDKSGQALRGWDAT